MYIYQENKFLFLNLSCFFFSVFDFEVFADYDLYLENRVVQHSKKKLTNKAYKNSIVLSADVMT